MRQAHSTSAALKRGLPRLVTLPGMRLVPLVCSPRHSPVYELMARRLEKRSHEQISRVITTVVNFPKPAGISLGAAASNSLVKALICLDRKSTRLNSSHALL